MDLQAHVGSKSIGTAFGTLFPVAGVKLLIVGNHVDLSAFLVIVWHTYGNKSTLEFSALVRTLVTEATVYFPVMISVQIYTQLSLSFMKA